MEKTLNDLLEGAIQMEIASQKMYSQALDIVKDQEAKDFLEKLIEEEKIHEKTLESVKEMDVYDGSTILIDDKAIEFSEKSHGDNREICASSTIDDILEIALKREYRAQNLFHKLAELSPAGELKTLFTNLAKEEEMHHKNISQQFSIQKGEMGYEM